MGSTCFIFFNFSRDSLILSIKIFPLICVPFRNTLNSIVWINFTVTIKVNKFNDSIATNDHWKSIYSVENNKNVISKHVTKFGISFYFCYDANECCSHDRWTLFAKQLITKRSAQKHFIFSQLFFLLTKYTQYTRWKTFLLEKIKKKKKELIAIK